MLQLYNPNEYWIKGGMRYKDQFRHNKNYQLQELMLID